MLHFFLLCFLAFQDQKAPAKKPDLPLKPERTIEFTTDEATWLSLTLTPDGKTIIFELLGDLYSLPVTGVGLAVNQVYAIVLEGGFPNLLNLASNASVTV